jgi:hypothetical protein
MRPTTVFCSRVTFRIDVTTQELEEMISNLRSKDARALRGRSYTNTKKEKKEKKQND